MNDSNHPPKTLLILAFAAIYVIWGSTYLAIRLVVETLPAFASASVRFLIAGGLLLAWQTLRGSPLPSVAEWKRACISGVLLLVGGNGLVVWAEKTIPSGLAALLVALAPVWFAIIDWLRPHGKRPEVKTVVGIVVGFIGVILLVQNRQGHPAGSVSLLGFVAVIAAGICWASGSLYSKHAPTSGSPWTNAAAQMICGGWGLTVVSVLVGEPFHFDWSQASERSLWALVYLVIAGSWVGFSAYIWLLKQVSAHKVATYAYVNPVIAVLLGWAVLGERVTAEMLTGALVVLAGVIIITLPKVSFNFFTRRTVQTVKAEVLCK